MEAAVTFRILGEPIKSYTPKWTIGQVRKWRIRKAPVGALPPWRGAEPPPHLLEREDGRPDPSWEARWWVWQPGHAAPCMCVSTFCGAVRYVSASVDRLVSPEAGEHGVAGGVGPGTPGGSLSGDA